MASFEQAPLRSCPKDIQAFLTALCAKQDRSFDHISTLTRAANSCGGITLNVQDVSSGETQYFYDSDGKLVGGHSRDYTATDSCNVSQAYGQTCNIIEGSTSSLCFIGLPGSSATSADGAP